MVPAAQLVFQFIVGLALFAGSFRALTLGRACDLAGVFNVPRIIHHVFVECREEFQRIVSTRP